MHSTRFPEFRSRHSQKRCPTCQEQSPATLPFCRHCGTSIEDEPSLLAANETGRRQFQLPEYLVGEQDNEYEYDQDHPGTGLVWFGVALVAVPALTSNLSPVSLVAWATGMVLVIAGSINARADRQSLLRAGAVMGVAGALTLGIIVNQIVSTRASVSPQISAPVADIDDQINEADSAAIETLPEFIGSVPVLRGSPEHTGVHPGPELKGNPYRAWRFDTGSNLKSTPVIDGGTAYVGTRDGNLIAIDLATGLQRWKEPIGDAGYPVAAAPAVDDNHVYVGSGYGFYALDRARGSLAWEFDDNGELAYTGESSPTVVDGVVYAASKEHTIFALDGQTGDRLWRYTTKGLIFGSPAVSNGIVVIGTDSGKVLGLNQQTGQMIWTYEAGGGVFSTPAILDDSVYLTLGSRTIIKLSLANGSIIWEHPIGGDASPAVSGKMVYVGSSDGGLYALSPSGSELDEWVFPTGSDTVLSPVIVNNTVYVAAGTTLFAIDRSTGSKIWNYPLGVDLTTEPVAVDGVIYVGSRDGNLYAIAGDGALTDEEAS